MKAVIIGVSGPVLSRDELAFIAEFNPYAFILFTRNIIETNQVLALTQALHAAVKRDALIFIDQEGGRVQRLKGDLAPNYPAAAELGKIYTKDPERGVRAAWLQSRLQAFDLRKLGINANCLPVLDVPVAGAHDVIGSRAYGNSPQLVTAMGRAAAQGLRDGGVLPVMKHIPGHGRAQQDTHHELARVDASFDVLKQRDFVPFKALAHLPAAMTAHVTYSTIDRAHAATLSPHVVSRVIRHFIGFDGLLMSDDLAMEALKGPLTERIKQAIGAGCDVVLEGRGNLTAMKKYGSQVPILQGEALRRALAAQAYPNSQKEDNENDLRQEFAQVMRIDGLIGPIKD